MNVKIVSLVDGKMLSLFYEDKEFNTIEYQVGKISRSTTKDGLFYYRTIKSTKSQIYLCRHPNFTQQPYNIALLEVEVINKIRSFYDFPDCLNSESLLVKRIIWSD